MSSFELKWVVYVQRRCFVVGAPLSKVTPRLIYDHDETHSAMMYAHLSVTLTGYHHQEAFYDRYVSVSSADVNRLQILRRRVNCSSLEQE